MRMVTDEFLGGPVGKFSRRFDKTVFLNGGSGNLTGDFSVKI